MSEQVTVTRDVLRTWGRREAVDPSAVERLWTELAVAADHPTTSRSGAFDLPHVAFYVGGLVALTAMSVFMTEGWTTYGPGLGLVIAVIYAAAFATGSAISRRRGWPVPAGILATVAVSLVPLIVFASQQAFGWWRNTEFDKYHDFYPWISSSWFAMEVVTTVVGLAVLWRVRFGLVLLPVGLSTWFMSMDLTELLFGPHPSDTARFAMALGFGMTMIGVGYTFDRVRSRDLAFWPHLFGLMGVFGALCYLASERGEWGWAIFGLVALGAVGLSLRWSRTTYVVFGGVGIYGWLGHLAFKVFRDTLLFPPVVAAIGIGIMWLGVALTRRRAPRSAVAPVSPQPADLGADPSTPRA